MRRRASPIKLKRVNRFGNRKQRYAEMSYITTKDGTQIFSTRTWGKPSRSSFPMVGRLPHSLSRRPGDCDDGVAEE